MQQVICSLCAQGGGTLRRAGPKHSGLYFHVRCVVAAETRLLAAKKLEQLNKYIEVRADAATGTVH